MIIVLYRSNGMCTETSDNLDGGILRKKPQGPVPKDRRGPLDKGDVIRLYSKGSVSFDRHGLYRTLSRHELVQVLSKSCALCQT